MERVAVVGTSGSGKSTVRQRLSDVLGLAGLELDAIHHLPGWVPRGPEAFRDEVAAFIDAHDRWVIDGNYAQVRDLVLGAADTVVWLDLSRAVTMQRVLRRSLWRVVTRKELWNGNREEWSLLLSRDPERSIIRWTWTTHARRRPEYTELFRRPEWQHLQVYRLTTPRQVRAWLASV